MAYEIPLFVVSFEAAADLSAKQYRAVKMATGGKVDIVSGATDKPIGILQNTPTSGKTAEVMLLGISKVDSDEALAVGVLISSQTDGQLEVADAGDYTIGHVVKASTAAGEFTTAFICPALIVKA